VCFMIIIAGDVRRLSAVTHDAANGGAVLARAVDSLQPET
jgi:hypothetical protein